MRTLIMTAVTAERDAVLRGLKGDPRFDVLVTGVGPVAAAASTAKALSISKYNLVVSAGIGGGFAGKAEIGSLVVADEIIAAQLGAETPEGFSSLDELGFGSNRIHVEQSLVSQVTDAMAAKLKVSTGAILTVSTVTGTAGTVAQLLKRTPNAAAEAMEGYGVAYAAHDYGLPVLEIRAISNLVGPRDRDAWRIKDALSTLETASSVLKEALA